jgi:hypothetical protein
MRVAYLVAGTLCAAASGVGYLGFLWGAAWAGFGLMRSVSLAAGAIAIIVALTLLFRPGRAWLFPLCFSGPILLVSIVALTEPRTALAWVVLGVITFAVALCGTYLARYVSKTIQRT